MGEFDDVLAMEPGDEWDDYDPGSHAPSGHLHAALVAQLLVPGGRVDLRGEVPATVLEAFTDLRADEPVARELELSEELPLATLTIESVEGGSRIAGLDELLSAPLGPEDLLDSLIDALVLVARSADPSLLVLRAAQVELGRDDLDPYSVLVVEPDELRRHAIVRSMVESGARFLSGDLTVLLAGSRVTEWWPAPMRTDTSSTGAGRAPGSDAGELRRRAVPGAVVFVERPDASSDAAAGLRRVDAAEGCRRLMLDAGAMEHAGSEALDVVAMLAAGVSFWQVPDLDPAATGELISSAAPSERRELVVTHDLKGPDEPVRFTRFEQGGVLCDQSSGATLRLEDDEVDALESLVCAGGRTPVHSPVFERIAREGVELPSVPSGRRGSRSAAVPVESFGLPGSPGPRSASSIWAIEETRRRARADPPVTAAVAEAVERGALSVSDDRRHELARLRDSILQRGERLRRIAATSVRRLRSIDVEPLVLGPILMDNDGPLPEGFTDASEVDLLVGRDQVEASVEVLSEGGFVRTDDEAAVQRAEASVAAELEAPGGSGVVRIFDRLAVGPFGELVDHDDFRRRATQVSIGGEWCSALHPIDRFVLACIDVSLLGTGPAIQEHRDVVLTAPRSIRSMRAVLEASERWGATTGLLAALRAVDTTMPGLPVWLVERAGRSQGTRRRR